MFRAALLSTLFFSFALAADAPPLTLTKTIPLDGVEGRIDHCALDAKRNRLYVAAIGNNTLEVIDLTAGKRIKSISGLKGPAGVRVLSSSGAVVIASGEDGMVRIFDEDFTLLGAVEGLDDADNVRLDLQRKRAYVGYGKGALAVIDPEKPAKIGEVKLDGHPEAFQLEVRGQRIFVNVPSTQQIAVIDREKLTVVAKWPVHDASANFPMALDERNHRLFIACRKPAKLLAIDTESGKVVVSVECCGDADDLFIDAKGSRVYVTGGEGCVSVIEQADADHYRTVGKVATAPGARTSLFDPESRTLYVAVPHRGNQAAEIRCYQSADR